MSKIPLFYNEFKGATNSVDYKYWKGLQKEEYKQSIEDIFNRIIPQLGKKFISQFNNSDHFFNRLFELYCYDFLKKRNIQITRNVQSNSELDIIFEINSKKVVCECMCINKIDNDDDLKDKVKIENEWIVKSPPQFDDKMVKKLEIQ
jgi:hypothetical protein